MKCIKNKCPKYHQSDIYKFCLKFGFYLTDQRNGCTEEDFAKYSENLNNEIEKNEKELENLNNLLELVKKNNEVSKIDFPQKYYVPFSFEPFRKKPDTYNY